MHMTPRRLTGQPAPGNPMKYMFVDAPTPPQVQRRREAILAAGEKLETLPVDDQPGSINWGKKVLVDGANPSPVWTPSPVKRSWANMYQFPDPSPLQGKHATSHHEKAQSPSPGCDSHNEPDGGNEPMTPKNQSGTSSARLAQSTPMQPKTKALRQVMKTPPMSKPRPLSTNAPVKQRQRREARFDLKAKSVIVVEDSD